MDRRIETIIQFFEKRYGPIRHRYKTPFEVLISCVLSQRTREENTDRACRALFSTARTPEEISKLPLQVLQKLIRPVGFWKQKADRIKAICCILLKEYGGKVPKTREELLKLPGVGFKTADVTLMYGHGIPSIAIDVHCNRIPKRLGLINEKATVEEVKQHLEDLFPREKWYLINLGFVLFGKEICKPIRPRCDVCPFVTFCKHAHKTRAS